MFYNVKNLKVAQATLFAYLQPFKTAIPFKNVELTHREGLILQLTDTKGIEYFTEIAPLPCFSKETLVEVKTALLDLISNNFKNSEQYHQPSIQFALNFIFCLSKLQSIQFKTADQIPLLQGDIFQQYQALNNPSLVKLKVARKSVKSDIANFQQLVQLNPTIKIRCDANQVWNRSQAEEFFSAINIERLDYIEEPTSDHRINLQLAEQYQVKLGLDETLQQREFHYQSHPCISAFIIKPTLIGEQQKIDSLIDKAKKDNLQVSFSSSFESILGLQQINQIAHYYQQHLPNSLGIDTLKYFNSPLLMEIKHLQQDSLQLEVLCNQHY